MNKNAVPNDPQKPWVTSGVRIGTPALTTRGFGVDEMRQIGAWIARVLERPDDEANADAVGREVLELSGGVSAVRLGAGVALVRRGSRARASRPRHRSRRGTPFGSRDQPFDLGIAGVSAHDVTHEGAQLDGRERGLDVDLALLPGQLDPGAAPAPGLGARSRVSGS